MIVTRLLWFRTSAVEDALAIIPEYLCDHVFRSGLTPYDLVTVCILPELRETLFLVPWALGSPTESLFVLAEVPKTAYMVVPQLREKAPQ